MGIIILSTDSVATVTVDPSPPHSEEWARELVSAQWLNAWPLAIQLAGLDVMGVLEREPNPFPATGAYAACSFRYLGERQMTQGARPRIEHRGSVVVRIWTPDDEGGKRASKLADISRGVFTRQQLSDSTIVSPVMIQTAEKTTDTSIGKVCQQTMQWPCYWHEQRTS